MIDIIVEVTKLLKRFTKEVHYQWNHSDTVTYPYITYTYTTEQLDVDLQQGVYIDFDLFDNQKGNNERIETVLSDLQAFFNDKDNRSILTDNFLMRIENMSFSPFPTGSDVLQRRTGQLYLKIDWRK